VKQFGWWFASAKLDDEWSVYQLLEALRLARQVELAHLVVERLVSIARKMPGPSIQALGMIPPTFWLFNEPTRVENDAHLASPHHCLLNFPR
jgi:hypothetical protein